VFQSLQKEGYLRPLDPSPLPNPLPASHRHDWRCAYHQSTGHSTEFCNDLRNAIQDLIDKGFISAPAPPKPNTVQNPLPKHNLGVNVIFHDDDEPSDPSVLITMIQAGPSRIPTSRVYPPVPCIPDNLPTFPQLVSIQPDIPPIYPQPPTILPNIQPFSSQVLGQISLTCITLSERASLTDTSGLIWMGYSLCPLHLTNIQSTLCQAILLFLRESITLSHPPEIWTI
jgi:hypothetical protein